MYVVLDIPKMMRVKSQTRNRKRPISGYNSTLLLRPGTNISLIPPNSEIRYTNGSWEVHMQIHNKKIVEMLAKRLDAIAFIC